MLQLPAVAPETHRGRSVGVINQFDPPIQVAIVDDDASVCKALGRLFRAAGIQATSFDSAESFLADKQLAEPDCLILDIQLSGMSGLELQRELRTRGRHTAVIFITAFDEIDSRLQAEAGGCVAYLRKTDPGDSVLETIQRITKTRRKQA